MTSISSGVGRVLSQSLHLSSDATHAREKAEEVERAAYRRTYWQGYTKKIKRIFGTVTPADYEAVKMRADDAGRSVWGQVWAEAQAYHRGLTVASGEIADQQRQLISELRRIDAHVAPQGQLGKIDQFVLQATQQDQGTFQSYRAFVQGNLKTLQYVLMTADVALDAVATPEMAALSATNSVDFDELRQRPTALYVVVRAMMPSGLSDGWKVKS